MAGSAASSAPSSAAGLAAGSVAGSAAGFRTLQGWGYEDNSCLREYVKWYSRVEENIKDKTFWIM